MKRAWTLLIALMLALSFGVTAFAQQAAETPSEGLSAEEKIQKLAELTQQYLDSENYTSYEYFDKDAYFMGTHNLKSALGQCNVFVDVYEDMLAVVAVPGIKVPEEHRANMAIFLTLANYHEYYSYFRMDYDDGEISSRSAQLVEETLPSLSEIDVLHYMPVLTLDEYGSGIVKVIGGADPHQAYQETMEEIKLARQQDSTAP